MPGSSELVICLLRRCIAEAASCPWPVSDLRSRAALAGEDVACSNDALVAEAGGLAGVEGGLGDLNITAASPEIDPAREDDLGMTFSALYAGVAGGVKFEREEELKDAAPSTDLLRASGEYRRAASIGTLGEPKEVRFDREAANKSPSSVSLSAKKRDCRLRGDIAATAADLERAICVLSKVLDGFEGV